MTSCDGMLLYQNYFSILDEEVAMDDWYNATSYDDNDTASDNRNAIAVPRGSSNHADVCEAITKYLSDGVNDWFYLTNASIPIRPESAAHCHLLVNDFCLDLAANLATLSGMQEEKPLPAAPQEASPYFDYLFANAHLHPQESQPAILQSNAKLGSARYSPDELSVEDKSSSESSYADNIDDASSPKSQFPATPRTTPMPVSSFTSNLPAPQSQAQTALDFSCTNPFAKHPAAAAPPVPIAAPPISDFDKAEKFHASVDFYGGFDIEEAPSLLHAPVIDKASGLGDIRNGIEAFPEQWMLPEEKPRYYTTNQANTMMRDIAYGAGEPQPKAFLEPKSQKSKAAKNAERRPSAMSVDEAPKAKSTKLPSYPATSIQVKKRAARISFDTRFAYGTSSDGDARSLSSKRARTVSHVQPTTEVQSPRATLCSLTSELGSVEEQAESHTASRTFSETDFSFSAPKAFPGQFRGIGVEESLFHVDSDNSSPTTKPRKITMGDVLHPNYLYTHTNFHPCDDLDTINHNIETAPTGSLASHILNYAYEMSFSAGSLERTSSQEHLRREVHLECTSARLEGVAVGRYRYYQGHLNVEEYKEAGICVCWDACACSKTCTRHGDVICPCSKHIQIHEH